MHFHSQLDQNNQWQKTLIEVPEQTTPYYRLYTDNADFKFATSKHTLFWGAICQYYIGVWMLRNDKTAIEDILKNQPIVQPIKSADIERYKASQQQNQLREHDLLSKKDYDKQVDNHFFQYFASYFAKELTNTPNGILSQGKWQITQGYTDNSQLCYTENLENKYTAFYLRSTGQAFRSQLSFINWYFNGSNELIAIKDKPHADSARVKWWRKKVKEHTCPPVLAWFLNPLDAYIIIDGHSRLVAYQLEKQPVKILILSQYIHVPIKENHKLEALRGLKQRLDSHQKNNTKPNIDDINQVLIQAYDDNFYEKIITTGKASNFTKSWQQEITSFRKNHNIDKKSLQAMLERRKVVKEKDNR